MNWLLNLLEDIKWKATEIVWNVQDKIEMWKLHRQISDEELDQANGISGAWQEEEVKPKKKKAKKKSAKKVKKSV